MIKDENDIITFDLSPFDRDDEDGDLYFWSFNDQKYKHLMKHPVVEAFLLIKWDSIWGWYFLNWFIYLIFLIVLTSMVYLDLKSNDDWHNALWVFLAILMVRELAQILTSKNICTDYFWDLENWSEWFVILTTILYLILLQFDENRLQDTIKMVSPINDGKNQWTINLGALALLSGKLTYTLSKNTED